MAEFSGYMYGSFAPVPNIYHRAARDKKAAEENPATQSSRKQPKPPLGLRRAQSATRAGSSSKNNTTKKKEKTSFASRFRGHTRTQSGSSASFSSAHEDRDAAARTARASSSPVRTSKDSSSGDPEPRSNSKSKPPPPPTPKLPTLQTQLYLDDEEKDEDDDDDSDHHHNHNHPPGTGTGTGASSSSPRPAAVVANKLRKPSTPTGSSSSRGRLPLAPVSGPWDDVSPYTYFPFGRARASADQHQQQHQRRPATGNRASTEPPLPSSPSSHPPLPLSLPSTDRERERVRSGSGLEPRLDDSSSDRLTRPSSRGRATLTGTLDRFHVPRFLSSSTASPSSEQTPSTPTPTTTSTAQAQAQAPSPLSMDIFHGAALTIWDQPKIPPPYPPPPPHHHHQHHARSPDHSSSPSSSTPNNPNTTTPASPQSNPRDRAAYFHASSSARLTPASINVANSTEHTATASVAANAAMAASSPYGSKNVSNPSIDASLTGTGRGSTSTSLSRIPSSPSRPFTLRAGRTYLADPTLPYPLPVDLSELHRQSLRTLLQIQVFGAPICSSAFASRPPARVLEVGCGSGFWSMMCHRYFSSRGHANISFVGMDVAPLAPSGSAGDPGSGAGKPDRDMKWRFVQHDMRQTPWPFPDGEFDLVMAKEVFMGITGPMQQAVMDEYLRLLRPGGVLEIWESDHQVRMLRPHAQVTKKKQPPPPPSPVRRKKSRPAKKSEDTTDDDEDNDEDETTGDSSSDATETEEDDDDDDDETSSSSDDEASAAASIGAYVMTANTPLSAPLNSYLVEFNTWINRALQSRDLSAVPCTILGPLLLQEADELMDVRSRRLAIPLAEVRWEREGVGGVVTKDGKSYIDSGRARREAAAKGKTAAKSVKRLTAGQAAVRRTAMLTVVQLVQSLEPLLRESSGKSQDEWDGWIGKMTNDLMRENGAGCGECLEVGAWWARKRGGSR